MLYRWADFQDKLKRVLIVCVEIYSTQTMSYQVYRIHTVPSGTNAFGVCRDETWALQTDRIFDDVEEARDYVIVQNRIHTELPSLLMSMDTETEREAFVTAFCFGDTHLHLQRYFLGKPNMAAIQHALKTNGVHVI
jgi:hypothetical protein